MKLARPAAPGRRVVAAAWLHLALLVGLAVPVMLGVGDSEIPLATFGLASLLAGFVVWIAAFVQAAARTTRGDDVVVASWVFLQGSAPATVRRHLLGAAGLTVALAIATMRASPFVWLANLLPLGLAALWSARHGTFPARRNMTRPDSGGGRGRPRR